jgi:hypothetical protein
VPTSQALKRWRIESIGECMPQSAPCHGGTAAVTGAPGPSVPPQLAAPKSLLQLPRPVRVPSVTCSPRP